MILVQALAMALTSKMKFSAGAIQITSKCSAKANLNEIGLQLTFFSPLLNFKKEERKLERT